MSEHDAAHFTNRDRETLTKVETKLDRAIEDIKSLSNSFAPKADLEDLEKRLSSLENISLSKFSSKDFADTWGRMTTDHEERLRILETKVTKYIAYSAAVLFISQIIIAVAIKILVK